jgi:hypothetical protein
MRTALLIVALFGLVALASAQTYSGSYTLKGSTYTDTACSAGANSISLTWSSSSALAFPCTSTGSGSTAWATTGWCYTYSYSGVTTNYWAVEVYVGATCPASGSTSSPTGYTAYGSAVGSDFSTCQSFYGTQTGSFKPSGCSSASTLVVPSFLLVALAFVASKLSL